MKFNKTEFQRVAKLLRNNIRQGKGLPKNVKMKGNTGKTHKLGITEYLGIFQQRNIFRLRNNREPNYITYNTRCSTLPIAMNYQDNGYTCGPTSLSMATMCLFGYQTEKTCAKECGTIIGSGTTPDKLINGAKKLGYTVKPIGRNYNNVLKSLQKGKPVIAHIQTKPATCLGYNGDYGHYILIYWCRKGVYFIADPTKGIKKCKATNIDKATNGRDIKYYSVGIQ